MNTCNNTIMQDANGCAQWKSGKFFYLFFIKVEKKFHYDI